MKKVWVVIILLASFLLAPFIPAQAETLITLSAPPSQLADGKFLNNELALSITSGGELDKVLSARYRGAKSWLIDPALLEEISALSDGYVYFDLEGNEVNVDEFPVAADWLNLLRFISRNDRVVTMTYGGPSLSYLQKVAPGELALYSQLSTLRLEELLGRSVVAPASIVQITKTAPLVARNAYTPLRKKMRIINSLVTTPDVENLRLGLAKTLNPMSEGDRAVQLTRSFEKEIERFDKRLRVSTGSYTITASDYELPVTIINDFDQLVSIDLDITTTNSRVLVTQVPRITVDARSQTQIKVPIQVIASGDTSLRLQLRTPNGSAIGEMERIPLRLAVISPITTWFTTGMAIILLLAAVIQSVRRVKRRKEHE
jgi:hypothetical protein